MITTSEITAYTPAYIEQVCRLMVAPGGILEVRVIDPADRRAWGHTVSGYFDNAADLARAVAKLDGRAESVYVTLQEIKPALLARAKNRLEPWAKTTTSDNDVVRYRWLLVDTDPKRPAKISATDDELAQALARRDKVAAWLSAAGWPDPLVAGSGNGGHLLYRLPDLALSHKPLVENALKALAAQFGDHQVEIDETVFNPSRVIKLYGTMACKGDDTPDRPHRRAHLEIPEAAPSPVTLDQLRWLAARAESHEHEGKAKQPGVGSRGDLGQILDAAGIAYARKNGAGYVKFVLDACLFNPDHKAPDAMFTQADGGAYGYKCLHNSCAGRDWAAARPILEQLIPGGLERFFKSDGQKPEQTTTSANAPERRKRPKTAEYIRVLGGLGYRFRINDCNDTLEVSGKPITDPLRAEIRAKMRDIGYWRVNIMEDAYLATGHGNRYHPVRDYLNSLGHDGGQHIGALTAHFQDRHDVFPVWLRRWLIGQVAKVMDCEQNAMLVLDGPQNIGKSYFVAWLASPLPEYFIEAPIDPGDKDNYVRLISAWMWEVAELGSTTRRADREALKHFISVRHVTVRKPYGRYDIRKPAMAGLIGTINNELGFLTDPTGSRRFLVATLTAIDWDYATSVDVNQVWAEAVAAWRAGESWRLESAEAKLAAELNEDYLVEDPIENLLREHFEIDPGRLDWWISSAEVLGTLQDSGLKGNTRGNQMGLSATMTRLGIQKHKRGRKHGYRGIDPIRNYEVSNR